MSDGQTRAEMIERAKVYVAGIESRLAARAAAEELVDETQSWPTPAVVESSCRWCGAALAIRGGRNGDRLCGSCARGETVEARDAKVAAAAVERARDEGRADARAAREAIERQQAGDRAHAIEMAKIEQAAELVELRAEARAAWTLESVAWAVGIFSALSAALSSAFTWAVLR